MILLDVPFVDEDEVKDLGAEWDFDLKKWCVRDKADYLRFARWIVPQGNVVVCDAIYLVEGKHICFRCGRETRVIGFALKNYWEMWKDSSEEWGAECCYYDDEIRIVGGIEPIPTPIMEHLRRNYNYKERYSKTTGMSRISNCCDHCDVLQGDHFLFQERNSPFFIDSEEKVRNLKFYKVALKYDIVICATVGYSSMDGLINRCGKYRMLHIDV